MTEYLSYILILAGLIVLGLSFFGKSTRGNLKDSGILVEGIIFNQDFDNNYNRSLDNFSRHVKDKITVRFVTKDGEWITEDIKQDFGIFFSGQYRNGDKINVYYSQDNPKNFYVDTKPSDFLAKFVFALVGLTLIATGLYQLYI